MVPGRALCELESQVRIKSASKSRKKVRTRTFYAKIYLLGAFRGLCKLWYEGWFLGAWAYVHLNILNSDSDKMPLKI